MTRPSDLAPSDLHPPDLTRHWREQGWWTGESLADFVRGRRERFADRTAVVGLTAADRADPTRRRTAEYTRLTHADLDTASRAFADRIRVAGAAEGDAVVLHLPNTVEFAVAVAATLRAGAIPVFALHAHREQTVARLATASGATVVVTAPDPAPLDPEELRRWGASATLLDSSGPWDDPIDPTVAEARPDPEGVGLLQLSGGTTGESKLIPRTHDGYLHSVRESARVCGLGPDSVLMVTLPASHNFPMSSPGLLGAWHVGATVVFAPDPSPTTGLRLVERHGVTHLSLVPPLARAFVDAAVARGTVPVSVEVVGVGGARLAESVAREIGPALGGRLQQVFGMAEGLVDYTRLDDPDEVVHSTQGRPLSPGDEIRIVDADGREVPPGVEGELQTRGPYTITRYLGDSARERSSFTDDGFYATGDLVRVRPDGNLVVTGRTGDRVNRAGETIPATEVEEQVLDHADVVEAVAVGVPDERLGEALVLAVTLRPQVDTIPDLRTHLRDRRVPRHWLPDRTVVLEAMPTTGVGKNSRRDLRDEISRMLADPTPEESHR